uniref:Transcription factor MYC/MYB N-terminal domain-containing protein n=1 Tax=Leersia perrieri TaxID=77586 RepID=A0A0D9XRS7_9ORYZ
MVGSGGGDQARSKEAAGMMALHEALRNVCLSSDWTYSVFWTIRPRPRCRGGNGCKVGDDNGSLMLMWEDGFCRPRVAECLEEMDGGEDPVRKAFSKMSIQLYNYGEGWVLYCIIDPSAPGGRLMGKVASDKCHKWVFKEPSECEPNIANYWQSSFDATIAVIQAGHGLLQLGSCKIIPEDLHFVLRMRHMFESLGYQSGFFLSQLFSSTRGTSPSPSSFPIKHPPPPAMAAAVLPPPQLFNWPGQPPPSQPQLFPGPAAFRPMPPPFAGGGKVDESHMFHLPPPPPVGNKDEHHAGDQAAAADQAAGAGDLKWPNGMSFFTALTGRADDAKLLFGGGNGGGDDGSKSAAAHDAAGHGGAENVEEYLSLESHARKARRMESTKQFKRSFTLPARMTTTTTASSANTSPSVSASTAAPPQQQGMEYRGGPHEGGGVYSDLMETFLE